VSCSKETPKEVKTDVTQEDVKQEAGEAVETTEAYLDQRKDEYIKQVEVKMEDIGVKTVELENLLAEETTETKEDLNEKIQGLKKKQEELQKKIDELKSSSAEEWEEFKTVIDKALDDLERAYDKAALSHFDK
jgi:hypothetical protein